MKWSLKPARPTMKALKRFVVSIGMPLFGLGVVPTSPAAELGLTHGLVAFWPLDEIRVSSTPDVVNGYDLNLVNLTTDDLVEGRWGKALRFDSARGTILERASLPEDEVPIYARHSDFTVSLWVNGPAQQADKRVFAESSTTDTVPLFTLGTHNTAANGSADVFIRDDNRLDGRHRYSDAQAFDHTWRHVLYRQWEVDGVPEAALYVDGVRDAVALDPRRPLTLNVTAIGGIPSLSAETFFNLEVIRFDAAITWAFDGATVTLSFPLVEDRYVQVEFSDDVAGAVWQLWPGELTSNGDLLTLSIPITSETPAVLPPDADNRPAGLARARQA